MFPATTLWAVEDPREMAISSGLATMGFALPAAIGAAYARPGSRVVCFTGDGGLGMCIGELETLARSGLPVTVVVFNDALLSLIAIKAKPQGHGGQGAVGFEQVDFAAVARAYGIAAAVATTPGELESAMREAMSVDGPFVVDARVDPAGYKDIMNVVRGPR
jgi:acetolactate synthase-1/2/3 large subunit